MILLARNIAVYGLAAATCAGFVGIELHAHGQTPAEAVSTLSAAAQTSETTQLAKLDVFGDPLPPGAALRLGSLRYRQPRVPWTRIAFLPDDRTFAVGGLGQTVHLWDAKTGLLKRRIDLGAGQLVAFCASPDGSAIATLTEQLPDATRGFRLLMTVWDAGTWGELASQELAGTMKDHGQQMAFSPDGQSIAMFSMAGTLRLWNYKTMKAVEIPSPFRDSAQSIVFCPDAKLVATAGRQGAVIWTLDGDQPPQKLHDVPGGAGVVRFSPDGRYLAVGSYDGGAAVIFSARNGLMLRQIEGKGRGYSREGMCFSADGKQLIVPAFDNAVEFFDVDSGKLVEKLNAQDIRPIGVAASPNGRLLACIGGSAAINVWDLPSGRRLSDQSTGHLDSISDVQFEPQTGRLATASQDGTVRIWNAATGRQEQILNHGKWPIAMAFSPDGKSLASCTLDNAVRLWDVDTGREVFKVPGHGTRGGNRSSAMAFSKDGQRFCSFGADLILRTYDAGSGATIAQHSLRRSKMGGASTAEPLSAAQDPFGETYPGGFQITRAVLTQDLASLVIGGSDIGTLFVFDVRTGKELEVYHPEQPWQDFLISSDGKLLATFEPPRQGNKAAANPARRTSTLRLRDFSTKKAVVKAALSGAYAFQSTFSPSGDAICFTQRVSTGGEQQLVQLHILHARDLQEIAKIPIESSSVRALSISPDGSRILCGFDDSTALVWNLYEVN